MYFVVAKLSCVLEHLLYRHAPDTIFTREYCIQAGSTIGRKEVNAHAYACNLDWSILFPHFLMHVHQEFFIFPFVKKKNRFLLIFWHLLLLWSCRLKQTLLGPGEVIMDHDQR